jgi:hypothetical protein
VGVVEAYTRTDELPFGNKLRTLDRVKAQQTLSLLFPHRDIANIRTLWGLSTQYPPLEPVTFLYPHNPTATQTLNPSPNYPKHETPNHVGLEI